MRHSTRWTRRSGYNRRIAPANFVPGKNVPQFLAGLFTLLLLFQAPLAQAQERVTLQLKHTHQFQFGIG